MWNATGAALARMNTAGTATPAPRAIANTISGARRTAICSTALADGMATVLT